MGITKSVRRGTCDLPPAGWYCSSEKGHEGPCPTYHDHAYLAEYLRISLAEENPDAIFFDGLEDAIVGIAKQYTKPPLVVYDRERILQVLQERDGMTYEEADEFCSFNIDDLWAGEGTPLILEAIT